MKSLPGFEHIAASLAGMNWAQGIHHKWDPKPDKITRGFASLVDAKESLSDVACFQLPWSRTTSSTVRFLLDVPSRIVADHIRSSQKEQAT
jgi:hypothetical protein